MKLELPPGYLLQLLVMVTTAMVTIVMVTVPWCLQLLVKVLMMMLALLVKVPPVMAMLPACSSSLVDLVCRYFVSCKVRR